MDQFVPDVTQADIERVVKRDFPLEEQENIRAISRELAVREKPRVVLACLKNSGGDIQKLQITLLKRQDITEKSLARPSILTT